MSADLASFGRRVRLGIVGGGLDSMIGRAHLIANRVDGLCEVVAGAMSIDPAIAAASARAELISDERSYPHAAAMAESEAQRSDRIDGVIIATPPQSHAEIATCFLDRGFDVICEKPMTTTLTDADALVATVRSSGQRFVLTHCYTGYPMVRHARAIIAAGEIGRVRLVEAEFAGGDPGVAVEPADPRRRHWRFRRSSMGPAAILGEVGTHAHNIAEYVTGHRACRVAAHLSTHAERREVFDNAYLTVSYDGGAVGRIWSSYVAVGVEHGLSFRIFGETGSVAWRQEDPEVLWLQPLGGAATRLSRGIDGLSAVADAATRFRPGHPEGYALAFANLYSDYARAVMASAGHDGAATPGLCLLPSVDDGRSTIAVIAAATESHDLGGVDVEVEPATEPA